MLPVRRGERSRTFRVSRTQETLDIWQTAGKCYEWIESNIYVEKQGGVLQEIGVRDKNG